MHAIIITHSVFLPTRVTTLTFYVYNYKHNYVFTYVLYTRNHIQTHTKLQPFVLTHLLTLSELSATNKQIDKSEKC